MSKLNFTEEEKKLFTNQLLVIGQDEIIKIDEAHRLAKDNLKLDEKLINEVPDFETPELINQLKRISNKVLKSLYDSLELYYRNDDDPDSEQYINDTLKEITSIILFNQKIRRHEINLQKKQPQQVE